MPHLPCPSHTEVFYGYSNTFTLWLLVWLLWFKQLQCVWWQYYITVIFTVTSCSQSFFSVSFFKTAPFLNKAFWSNILWLNFTANAPSVLPQPHGIYIPADSSVWCIRMCSEYINVGLYSPRGFGNTFNAVIIIENTPNSNTKFWGNI